MDPKVFQLAVGCILGILGWSLTRNIRDLDKKIDEQDRRIAALEGSKAERDVTCARRHPDDP